MSSKRLAALARKLPVTQYMEYQDYLRDLYLLAKEEADSYSYLRFAEDLGFSATNVLRLVIVRKRRLAEKSAKTIAESLGLRNEDKKYFLNLVRYANSPSQETKTAIFLRIYEDKKTAIPSAKDKDLMEYYASWCNPVVMEMLNLPSSSQDPELLAKQIYPRLLTEQINKAIDLLQRLKMIQWSEGRWVAVDQNPRIVPEDQAAGMYSAVQFHLQMIEIAAQCLLLVPRQEREYNALTIKLSTGQIPALKEKIREFCASVMAMEHEVQASDRIMQVNVQMFPFTKLVREEGVAS